MCLPRLGPTGMDKITRMVPTTPKRRSHIATPSLHDRAHVISPITMRYLLEPWSPPLARRSDFSWPSDPPTPPTVLASRAIRMTKLALLPSPPTQDLAAQPAVRRFDGLQGPDLHTTPRARST